MFAAFILIFIPLINYLHFPFIIIKTCFSYFHCLQFCIHTVSLSIIAIIIIVIVIIIGIGIGVVFCIGILLIVK